MLLSNLNVHDSPLGALTFTYLCCRCLITEEKLVVENKGFDSYLADNCANIIFSTNWGDEDVILPIGVYCTWGAATCGVFCDREMVCKLEAEDDRRFVLYNVRPKNFNSFEEKQQVGLIACSCSMPYHCVICRVDAY